MRRLELPPPIRDDAGRLRWPAQGPALAVLAAIVRALAARSGRLEDLVLFVQADGATARLCARVEAYRALVGTHCGRDRINGPAPAGHVHVIFAASRTVEAWSLADLRRGPQGAERAA